MITIHVKDREGREHAVEAHANDHLMEVLREFDWGVAAICGGMCSCATCHVFVDADWAAKLDQRQDDELELLEGTECYQPDTSRLACQIVMNDKLDGIRLVVAPEE